MVQGKPFHVGSLEISRLDPLKLHFGLRRERSLKQLATLPKREPHIGLRENLKDLNFEARMNELHSSGLFS